MPYPQKVVSLRVTSDGEVIARRTDRMDYATSLANELGIKIWWVDLTAIADPSTFWKDRQDAIWKALVKLSPEFTVYVNKGFTQSAKSGMAMLLHKDQTSPFPDPEDGVRWAALTTPLYGGPHYPPTFWAEGKFIVTNDAHLGLGDGWANMRDMHPSQIRIALHPGQDRPHKTNIHECAIIKGMIAHHPDIPEGYAGRLPKSCTKALVGKKLKVGDTIEGKLLVGIKCEVGPLRKSRLGYMGVMHQVRSVFKAMESATKRAIATVKEFIEDPIGHMMNNEFIPWKSPEELEHIVHDPEMWRDMNKSSFEEDDNATEEMHQSSQGQNRLAVLPWVGWLYSKTGNKELLKSKFVATMLQEAVSMKLVAAHLHAEAETWYGFAAPPQFAHQMVDEVVFMNPKDVQKFEDERVIGKRDPVLMEESLRALTRISDPTVWEGVFVMTPKTFAIMMGDFDGDGVSMTAVTSDPDKAYWTELMWKAQTKWPNTTDEKIRGNKPSVPPKTMDEALCRALAVNVGEPTNAIIRMVALKQTAKARYFPRIDKMAKRGADAAQNAVDNIKHGREPDLTIGEDSMKLAEELGGYKSDMGWSVTFKAGAEERPWSLDDNGNVRDVHGISRRTAIGAHIMRFQSTVPVAMVEIKSNAYYKHWIQYRPGTGYDQAQAAWKKYSADLEEVSANRTDWGQMKLQRQALGKNWRDMWEQLNKTASRQWMEQAMSGLWALAFEEGANQNRLFGTNLPVIFQLIVDDWNKPRPIEGIEGDLLGIGKDAITTGSTKLDVIDVIERTDKSNKTCQFLKTLENDYGFKVVGTFIPAGMTSFTVNVTPLTDKTSRFKIA